MDNDLMSFTITAECSGLRLDQALAKLCPQFSRARLQAWIKSGHVQVNGHPARQRDRTRAGQRLDLRPRPETPNASWAAENIPLDIVHEDEHILVLNKPAGLIVHPGAGHPDATLLNALLYHCDALRQLPRAGIIQRLDKDTSGIMIIAKSSLAHTRLVKDMQQRKIRRQYRALVHGEPISGGRIAHPIGRDPTQRLKMAVIPGGKPAVTHYRLAGRYNGITELQVNLETGRTHQIRVHLAYIKHPVIGDPVYAHRNPLPKKISAELRQGIQGFTRQALHAEVLGVTHPLTGVRQHWQVPAPADYQHLLAMIKQAHAE